MKIIWMLLVLLTSVMAQKYIAPIKQYKADAQVLDVVVKDGRIYCATAGGCVDVFDLKHHKLVERITVKKIKDFMGDLIDTKVYSVDVDKKRVLLLTQAQQGYRRLYIHEGDTTKIVLDYTAQLPIAKAKFLDEHTVLLALLSDELLVYDLQTKTIKWRVQASGSTFSDFAINAKHDKVAVADESGEIQRLVIKDGAHLTMLKAQNLDNVFALDYKNGIIATAGKDRRCVVYDVNNGHAYYRSSHFFIYGVGLSPSGKIAAYSSDENNNITLFNTKSNSVIAQFGGNKMTISGIVFLNEKQFLVYSDSRTINLYQVP